jgi:hypothetical protein
MPLTKLQKDILISLDVNPNEVEKSLVNLNWLQGFLYTIILTGF